ncbi:uncharacterized protein N7479_002920 [Penicillium vulpinum]|uniref:uncharacterized protein n=1 Tax=Penicillium vulpinum TaxID=29845 RepID=UPI002546CBF4|nr:uncharacterized protein N7479_002920 [Penicillium vulpinum]KAJ5973002.1 hypothetical protein N7479_002920 [Penicillium vulpinum]
MCKAVPILRLRGFTSSKSGGGATLRKYIKNYIQKDSLRHYSAQIYIGLLVSDSSSGRAKTSSVKISSTRPSRAGT